MHTLSPGRGKEAQEPAGQANFNAPVPSHHVQYPDLTDIGTMNIEQVCHWLSRIHYSVFYDMPLEAQKLSYNDSIRYLAELVILNH